MVFGEEEKDLYDNATTCWICREEFSKDEESNYKVRDHCNFTGTFRGAAHNICNLKYRVLKYTPVFFHNLSGYDAHLLKILVGVKGILIVFLMMKNDIFHLPKVCVLVPILTNKEK